MKERVEQDLLNRRGIGIRRGTPVKLSICQFVKA